MTAQRVDAAACHPDIAEQQLQHARRADDLCARRVVRPAERVQDCRRAIRYAGAGEDRANAVEIINRRPAQAVHHLRRIAIDVRFKQIPDATRVAERIVTLYVALLVQLIEPARFIVLTLFGVIAAEQTVIERIVVADNQAGVGIGADVFVLDGVMRDQIANSPQQKRSVRPGANRRIQIGHRRTAVKARIDHHHRGVVFGLRFNDPFKADRMGLRRVAAHDQHHVGVFNINPVIGHRPATKGRCQGRNGWTMAQTRLTVDCHHAQRAGKFSVENTGFITGRRRTEHARSCPAVNRQPLGVLFDKVGVTIRFHQAGNTLNSVVP
ncbi:hypothetical protein D3C78_704560 [compost metagenome]